MKRLFKLLIVCILLKAGLLAAAQDSLLIRESLFRDSLQDLQLAEMEQELKRVETAFRKWSQATEKLTDSLRVAAIQQQEAAEKLRKENIRTGKVLGELQQSIGTTRAVIAERSQRFNRIIFIAVPSLLILILLSTLIFFWLISRLQQRTDSQIRTLKRYTYEGIEEIRTDYVQEMKRRLKKFSSRLKKNEKKAKRKKARRKKK